jgi:hypothetical protein
VVDRLVDEVRRLEDEVAALRDRRGQDGPGGTGGDRPGGDWSGSDEPGTHDVVGLGNGWADGYEDFRRPASTVRDDDGAGDR